MQAPWRRNLPLTALHLPVVTAVALFLAGQGCGGGDGSTPGQGTGGTAAGAPVGSNPGAGNSGTRMGGGSPGWVPGQAGLAGWDPGSGAGGMGGASAEGGPCGGTLASRLTVVDVPVDEAIDSVGSGYNGTWVDRRIPLAVQPNGNPQIAWMPKGRATVRVTPLNAALARRAADATVAGIDLGGLVAHDDGFAVLTRRQDPGENLAVGDPAEPLINNAAFLVRFRNGSLAFEAALTGTTGLDQARDYSNGIEGSLKWNGTRYGAYFVIRGGKGHWAEGHYGDKLAYLDDTGKKGEGGWGWGCSHNEGIRLIPEPGTAPFTAACMSDGFPDPGLNLLPEGKPSIQVANEQAWAGYCAGQFGSLVKLPDGTYVVGWLSKRVPDNVNAVPHDVAFQRLDTSYKPQGATVYLTNTPAIDETSLHLALYGTDAILVTYGTINDATCTGTCTGTFGGTKGMLVDFQGATLSPPETLPVTLPQNDDIVPLDAGSLGWAYAESAPDYSNQFDPAKAPPQKTLHVARLRVCK